MRVLLVDDDPGSADAAAARPSTSSTSRSTRPRAPARRGELIARRLPGRDRARRRACPAWTGSTLLPALKANADDARHPRRPPHRLRRPARGRRGAPAPTRSCGSRSARSSCSPWSSGSRAGATAFRFRATSSAAVRRGAAPALRARPPPSARDRARASARCSRTPTAQTVARARERARVEGHRHARALAARAALRARARRGDRPRARSTTRAPSTASCSTTSARSAIPDGVLQKPRRSPTPSGALMQTHTILGEQMLARRRASCRGRGCTSCARTTSAGTATATRTGSRGDEIPLGARIFAVADALDAMTSDRPYRAALPLGGRARRDRRAVGRAVRPRRRRCVPRVRVSLREVRREFDAAA